MDVLGAYQTILISGAFLLLVAVPMIAVGIKHKRDQ